MRAQAFLVATVLFSAFSAACYSGTGAAPDPTGTVAPASEGPNGTDDPGPTPSLVASQALAGLLKAKVRVDLPLHLAVSAAMAADAHDGEETRLRAIMSGFTKSLGVKCDFCHEKKASRTAQGDAELDFAADTANKKLAERMWDEWVVGLRMADKSPLFCDSCHQGKTEFLDRSDEDQLHAWMKQNFAQKLVQASGAPVGCGTCHGKPFNGEFLDDWAGKKSDDAKE